MNKLKSLNLSSNKQENCLAEATPPKRPQKKDDKLFEVYMVAKNIFGDYMDSNFGQDLSLDYRERSKLLETLKGEELERFKLINGVFDSLGKLTSIQAAIQDIEYYRNSTSKDAESYEKHNIENTHYQWNRLNKGILSQLPKQDKKKPIKEEAVFDALVEVIKSSDGQFEIAMEKRSSAILKFLKKKHNFEVGETAVESLASLQNIRNKQSEDDEIDEILDSVDGIEELTTGQALNEAQFVLIYEGIIKPRLNTTKVSSNLNIGTTTKKTLESNHAII